METYSPPSRDMAAPPVKSDHLGFVDSLIGTAISNRLFPGCVYGVITPTFSFVKSYGNYTYEDGALPVIDTTYFDVASITKTFPTSLLLLRLIDKGEICRKNMDVPIREYLPEFSGQFSDLVTVRHLLSYGFELNLSGRLENLGGISEINTAIMKAGLVRPPGFFHYANSTSFIAMKLVERLYGIPYEEAAKKFIFEPLKLSGGFLSQKLHLSEVVPSEVTSEEVVHGIVHDEFSRHLLRTSMVSSGASGLFLSGLDGMKILRAFCFGSNPVLGASNELFGAGRFGDGGFSGVIRTNQLNDPNHRYGLGFDILDTSYGPCGCSTESTILITGFTGCVIMLQPNRGKGFFLFSNAIYPKRGVRGGGRSPLYELRRSLFHSIQTCKHCLE